MANYRKVISVDNDMLINYSTNTAVLFVNQRSSAAGITKRPVVLKGTTPSRLRLKMKHFIERVHAPVT